jgi:hypothetical protein
LELDIIFKINQIFIKTTKFMKTNYLKNGAFALLSAGLLLSSCAKKDVTEVSVPPLVIGTPVSDAGTVTGSVKGTMLTGKTYTCDDITINAGDTLLLQPGVTVKMNKGKTIWVKGTLISLGTKTQPSFIGPSVAFTKNTAVGAKDSAYVGFWTGINCEPTCKLLVLKWTHVDYTGASFGATLFPTGKASGAGSFGIMFNPANGDGDFIMEDSWMYGSIDDAIRISTGRIHIMRNTYEKCGATGGDCLNAKSGVVGDMAYNLFVGTATNGTKASNKGGVGPQTQVNMYNNTYISGGYRQKDPTGRGGSLNYEEGAKGKAFNNLMVNCRTGLRIHNNPAADVANISYGYNFTYGDSARVMNMVYPVNPTTAVTVPQSTDIPSYTTLLSDANYQQALLYTKDGSGNLPNFLKPYDGSAYVKQNNPMFVNFPLPLTGIKMLADVSAAGSFNFRLSSGSPAIGKGTSDANKIAPIRATMVTNANFKPSEVTLPGVDMGCYQSNGTGNQH